MESVFQKTRAEFCVAKGLTFQCFGRFDKFGDLISDNLRLWRKFHLLILGRFLNNLYGKQCNNAFRQWPILPNLSDSTIETTTDGMHNQNKRWYFPSFLRPSPAW